MFSHRGAKRVRKGPILLALLAVVSLATSLVTATVQPETASAANANTALINAGRAWVGYRFILDNHRDVALSQEVVDNMRYIPGSGFTVSCWELRSGHLLEPQQGVMNIDGQLCGNPFTSSDRATPAFTAMLAGIGYDRVSFITSLGYTKGSSGLYEGGAMSQAALEKSLRAKWPSSLPFPSLSGNAPPGWIQYLDLVEGLQRGGCLRAGLMEFPSPPASGGTIISLVDAQGNVGSYSVTVNNKDIAVAIQGQVSCQDAAGRLAANNGALAKEYAESLKKLSDAAAQNCNTKYFQENTLRDACEKGAENKSDPEFCARTYTNPAEQEACRYGQQYANDQDIGDTDPGGDTTQAPSNCTVPGMGWIVCPVAKLVASVVDGIFTYMIEPLLVTPAINTSSGNNGMQGVWGVMRNIANIAFIFAFLIVIYSQITGAGLSNYGIKRMLPRLIVGAILLNTSFWVCALAVDLSNIAGKSIHNLLMDVFTKTLNPPSWEAVVGFLLAGGAGTAAVGAGLNLVAAFSLGPALTTVALWITVPLLLGALIAVITAGVVLALRQALIVVLIVISPLAIAAYLLPNTQQWFDKWRKMFTTALLFYPLYAIIFAGSQVAASILFTASGATSGTNNVQGDMTGFVLFITGMALQVFPLGSAPFVVKFSAGLPGNIGAKIQGGLGKMVAPINKYARGQAMKGVGLAIKQGRNRAEAVDNVLRRRSRISRGVSRVVAGFSMRERRLDSDIERANAEAEAINAERKLGDSTLSRNDIQTRLQKERAASANREQTSAYLARLRDDEEAQRIAAGVGGETARARVAAGAQAAEAREFAEAVKNIELTASFDPGSIDEMVNAYRDAVENGDQASARAYQNMMYRSGAPGHSAWQEATIDLENSGAFSTPEGAEVKRSLRSNITENHGDMKSVNNAAMNWAIDNGDPMTGTPPRDLSEHFNDASTYANLSAREIIKSKNFVQQKALDLGAISQRTAQDIVRDVDYNYLSEAVKSRIEALARGGGSGSSGP